jgi:hypothetical protein
MPELLGSLVQYYTAHHTRLLLAHGKVAWRMKSGALVVAPGVTREEHRAMLEYISDMESLMPLPSRETQVENGNRAATAVLSHVEAARCVALSGGDG